MFCAQCDLRIKVIPMTQQVGKMKSILQMPDEAFHTLKHHIDALWPVCIALLPIVGEETDSRKCLYHRKCRDFLHARGSFVDAAEFC